MTKSAFFKTGALGALATALLAFGLPAQAQDRGRGETGEGGPGEEMTAIVHGGSGADRCDSARSA